MPQNDMGTAHGRIRLEFDDRGSGKATAALLKIHQQMEAMNKRLAVVQRTLEANDKALEKSSKSFDKAAKASKGFSAEIFSAHKSVTSFSRDLKSLAADINKVQSAFERMRDISKPFELGYRAVDQFNKHLDNGSGKIGAFSKAMKTAGITSVIFNKQILQNMLGLKSAMRDMPLWTQNLARYAGGLAKVGIAAAALDRLAQSGNITKWMNSFANLGPIRKAILENERFARGMEGLFRGFEQAPGKINKFLRPLSEFGRGTRTGIAGFALMSAGINEIIDRFRWLGKIPKPILYGLNVMIADVLPAALKVLGKTLTWTSNVFVGLLDGIKQLSGGLLVLPGLLATIGAAVTPLIGVFAGLKKQFKDLFGQDEIKSLEAYYKLPAAMRPLARTLMSTAKEFSKVQETLQAIAVAGLDKQIDALGKTYLPRFADGATKVLLAFRQMKDEVVGFLQGTQSQKDFSTIYTNTAVAITAMARSIRPALDGFRNLAVVGNEFIANMTAGMPKVTERFARWTQVNRENGRALDWMEKARKGVMDLYHGTADLTKALWTVLTIFKTNPGNNWLQSFADSMAKFNASVKKSASVGFLRDIGNAIRSMANNKIDNFNTIWKDLVGFLHRVGPLLNDIATTFSQTFVPFLRTALHELGLIGMAIRGTGLQTLLGWVLGLTAGWKSFSNILLPLTAKLKIFIGLFMTLKNAEKVMGVFYTALFKVTDAMSIFGAKGTKVGQSIAGVATRMSGIVSVASRVIGSVTAIGAAIAIMWKIIDTGNNEINGFNNQLQKAASNSAQFSVALHKAFIEDRAMTGRTVMDTIGNRLDQLQQDLQDTADQSPGYAAKMAKAFDFGKMFGDWKSYIAPWLKPQDEQIKKMEDTAGKARMAAAGIQDLKDKGVNLSEVLASSDKDFGEFIINLQDSGDQGKATADALQETRRAIKEAERDMAELGPAGAQAAAGFDKLAHSAGSAQTKLEGLKQVLQALGILKTDALEAAANYADAVENLSKKVEDAISSGDGLDKVWDKVNNTLNVSGSQTARNLVPVFQDLSNWFLQNAAAGGDVNDMLDRLDSKLAGVAQQLGISKEDLKSFLQTSEGINGQPVSILVQLDKKGLDEATKDFGLLVTRLQTMASNNGVFVPIDFGTHEAAASFDKAIEKLLGKDYFDSTGKNLTIKPGVQIPAEDVQKLLDYLSSHGINTSGSGGAAPTTQQTPKIQPDLSADEQNQLEKLKKQRDELQSKLDLSGAGNGYASPILEQTKQQLDQINAQISDLESRKKALQQPAQGVTAPGGQPATATSTPPGEQSVQAVEQQTKDLNDKMTVLQSGLVVGWNNVFIAITQALQNALKSVAAFMEPSIAALTDDKTLKTVSDAGWKFVDAYAQGLSSNPAAIKAAEDMAEAIRRRFHQSPPKEGPLAAHGDAAVYAGQQFGVSYSRGLIQGAPTAADAAAGLGSAAIGGSSQAGSGAYGIGQAFGARLSALTQFIGHAIQAFSKLGETALGFMKVISDPMGRGTWFGQSMGTAFGYVSTGKVSQAQRQKNYEDRLQQAAIAAGTGATRNLNGYNPLTGMGAGQPGQLAPNASKAEIQAAVAAQGLAVGATPEDIAAAIAVIQQEGSGYNPAIIGKGQGGGGTDAVGLFQQSPYQDPQKWGRPEDLIGNPQKQIENYWHQWQKATGGSPLERAWNVQAPGAYSTGTLEKYMPQALKDAQAAIAAGPPTASGQAVPGLGQFIPAAPPILHDYNGKQSQAAPIAAAAIIAQLFPGITNIGGARNDSLPYHSGGRALDVMIPGWDTPQGKALGDQIKAFFLANASAFGVEDTIWQNFWQPPGAAGHGMGSTGSPTDKHLDHVHITFKDGAVADIGPQGTNLKMPFASGVPLGVPQGSFGVPNIPGTPGATPNPSQQLYTLGPDGKPTPIPMQGPDSQGMKLSSRLTADGLEILNPKGEVIATAPMDQPTSVELKDAQGRSLGTIQPGGQGEPGKPKPPPFLAPPQPLNPATGKPWTPEEAAKFAQDHPLQLNYGDLTPQQISDLGNTPGIITPQPGGSITDLNPAVSALLAQAQGPTGPGTPMLLQQLELQRQGLLTQDTPASRAQAKAIEQTQNQLMAEGGFSAAQSPVDQAMGFLQGASGVAGDIINTIQSGIDAAGATKNIADTLTRGIQNTENIYNMVDDVQKYITFAANIAQSTGDVLQMVANVIPSAGGADFGGTEGAKAALSGAAQISQLISAGLQTANAVIDLGQEAYRIMGSYVGPWLQNIVGGAGGGLQGNIRFLLDQQTNQLLAYSADNPLDKRPHDLAFQTSNPNARNQLAGQINVYGGPGSDPRDNTRQMMFQVKQAQLSQVVNG